MLVSLGACAAGPRAAVVTSVDQRDLPAALAAYDRALASDGGDRALLARVAALLLELEAMETDPARRRAAVQALASAGEPGRASLSRLLDGPRPARLEAMIALARRGDSSARHYLRGLADSSDAEERSASVLGMDGIEDRALLLERLVAPEREARQVEADRLVDGAPDADVGNALARVARVDPEPGVRAAACRSLGAFDELGVDVLRERLSDEAASVRLAAVEALTRASPARAREILGPLLAMPPSPQGIEAARLLSTPSEEGAALDADALAFLRSALHAPDAGLRAQAGVALVGLRDATPFRDDLSAALARAVDATAKLSLARALLRVGSDGDARRALTEPLSHGDGMSAVQAAVALAELGDDDAKTALTAFLVREDAAVRRVAARGLAREANRPEALRPALDDADASVRIAAAGGILAAAY